MLSLLLIFNMMFPGLYADFIDYSSSTPVKDKDLKKRLTVTKTYRTKKDDNIVKVAYRVYGHRTWWSKIKTMNPKLTKYEPYEVLPVNTAVKYNAPVIGEEYTVESNDTLSRIAEWKYGDLELWRDLYDKNREKIENPHIINPGDKLIFSEDGTIKKAATGEIIVKGVDVKQAVAAVVVPPPVPPPAPVIVPPPEKSFWEKYPGRVISNTYYLVTLIVIVIILAVFMYLIFPRRIDYGKYTGTGGDSAGNFKQNVNMDADLNPAELLRPNYFSLLKRWWKKYLRFFGKDE
jgi:hypothetical protein